MIDADTFRSVLGRFASGVTIVTARDDDGRDHGMTVSAFCSLSLEPPMVLLCVDRTATMYELMHHRPALGISILSSSQEAYSRRFADPTSDRAQRFEGMAYGRGSNGAVLLDGALAHLECRALSHHDAGDHTIVIAEIERAEALDGRPLLYFRGGYAQLER
jgi:flavin reductase (DIM6/NTAB) family NADH-FMN oxidoreductase RutF